MGFNSEDGRIHLPNPRPPGNPKLLCSQPLPYAGLEVLRKSLHVKGQRVQTPGCTWAGLGARAPCARVRVCAWGGMHTGRSVHPIHAGAALAPRVLGLCAPGSLATCSPGPGGHRSAVHVNDVTTVVSQKWGRAVGSLGRCTHASG